MLCSKGCRRMRRGMLLLPPLSLSSRMAKARSDGLSSPRCTSPRTRSGANLSSARIPTLASGRLSMHTRRRSLLSSARRACVCQRQSHGRRDYGEISYRRLALAQWHSDRLALQKSESSRRCHLWQRAPGRQDCSRAGCRSSHDAMTSWRSVGSCE